MRIEPAAVQHAAAYPDYFLACRADGCEVYADTDDSPQAFFQRVLDHAAGRRLPPGCVPCLTWFALCDDGRILGAIRLRLGTTRFIREVCGHIGYEVLPAARGQGVAQCLLDHVCRHGPPQWDGGWLLLCDENNLASRRVIEHAGGRLLALETELGCAQRQCRYHLVAKY